MGARERAREHGSGPASTGAGQGARERASEHGSGPASTPTRRTRRVLCMAYSSTRAGYGSTGARDGVVDEELSGWWLGMRGLGDEGLMDEGVDG